jgi:enoyl-CoA hydratase/carnithine racemase
VGVVTISRESYGWDVDRELNRALDWLKTAGIRPVIVTGDFHLSTQMVGADTAEFFPTLDSFDTGLAITQGWSRTARRLWDEFEVSVAFVPGKRCLGGMLELLMHCHYLVAVEDARFGWPEVTLPVVPGMEGCHWPLRRARRDDRPRLVRLLLTGEAVKARDAVGWLADAAVPMDEALRTVWSLANGRGALPRRPLEEGVLAGVPTDVSGIEPADSPGVAAGRAAIVACMTAACAVDATEALPLQARLAAEFLASAPCREGRVGAEAARVRSA